MAHDRPKLALGLLFDVICPTMLTILQRFSARQVWAVATVTSRNTNRLVSQSIAGEIDRIDMVLRNVQHEYFRMRAAGRIDQRALSNFLRLDRKSTRLNSSHLVMSY